MADQPKTLEMRVAELEDKLAKLNITEDDMKAYHKVSAALGSSPSAAPALSPQLCQIQPCHILACIRQACWSECRPCSPCICSTCQACFTAGGGGFGTLGS